MPRGQKPGWKLNAKVPKARPTRAVRVATGVWLKPSGKFATYIYFRGKDRFIGCFPSVQEAVDARELKRQELKAGRPILRRTETAATVTTFAEHVYFPETLPLVKESTARTTMSRYRQHVLPAFTDVPLRDVTY